MSPRTAIIETIEPVGEILVMEDCEVTVNYTPKEIAQMAFIYLVEAGARAFIAQLAHKHMYLFCKQVSY